jgi:hypothetical protein
LHSNLLGVVGQAVAAATLLVTGSTRPLQKYGTYLSFRLFRVFGGRSSFRMKTVCVISLLSVLIPASCSSILAQTPTAPSPSTNTGIEGVISIGPSHGGPARIGIRNSSPLANTEFIIAGEKEMPASFKTDDQGKFRVVLPPGHYQVTKKEKSRLGGCGPFEVDIAAGQMTKVEWSCDSGMR